MSVSLLNWFFCNDHNVQQQSQAAFKAI